MRVFFLTVFFIATVSSGREVNIQRIDFKKIDKLYFVKTLHPADGGSLIFQFLYDTEKVLFIYALNDDDSMGGNKEYNIIKIMSDRSGGDARILIEGSKEEDLLLKLLKNVIKNPFAHLEADEPKNQSEKRIRWLYRRIDDRKLKEIFRNPLNMSELILGSKGVDAISVIRAGNKMNFEFLTENKIFLYISVSPSVYTSEIYLMSLPDCSDLQILAEGSNTEKKLLFLLKKVRYGDSKDSNRTNSRTVTKPELDWLYGKIQNRKLKVEYPKTVNTPSGQKTQPSMKTDPTPKKHNHPEHKH